MSKNDDPLAVHRAFEAIQRAAHWPEHLLTPANGSVYMSHNLSLMFSGFRSAWRYLHGAEVGMAVDTPPAVPPMPLPALDLETAPIGSKALCEGGGFWCRVQRGWKWNGPDGNGRTLPAPGDGWTGNITAPKFPPSADGEPVSYAHFVTVTARLNHALDVIDRLEAALNAHSKEKEIQS